MKRAKHESAGPVGDGWYRATSGALVNLKSAQEITVLVIDGVATMLASYGEGVEFVLGQFKTEEKAWAALDQIQEKLIEHHKIATSRTRFGHG